MSNYRQKICKKCNKSLLLSEFYTDKRNKDGVINKCKRCAIAMIKKNIKKNPTSQQSYHRSEKGAVKAIYYSQVHTSKLKNQELPDDYTQENLRAWLYKNGFKNLYDEWVLNDYLKAKKPAIYKLNYALPFSFNNIALTTVSASFKLRNLNHSKKLKNKGILTKAIVKKKVKVKKINVKHELNKLHRTTFLYENKQVYLDNWIEDVLFLKPTHKGSVLFNSISTTVRVDDFFSNFLSKA